MYFLYRIVLTVGFLVMLPKFLIATIFKGKYAAGFKQRLGYPPKFNSHGKKVVWLHCVSVGETNAVRQLAQSIKRDFPHLSLVVSTTTKTGQKVAHEAFAGIADLIFYFPLDFRSFVRRSLRQINPSVILLTETEIWFNFLRESYKSGRRVMIINGRLSEKSFRRYGKIKKFMKRVLSYLELALMQDNEDATRLMSLGIRGSKVRVTGNLKFDHDLDETENALTQELRDRFGITREAPLIIAASTHSPEEKWVIEAFKEVWKSSGEALPRLMVAPRHPERFAEVGEIIKRTGFAWVRRSEQPSGRDKTAEIILLDSIGELRAAYPLAEIVFVGGSLIPHGGQSIYEPAASGRAILIGPHVANFEAAVNEFLDKDAIVRIDSISEKDAAAKLAAELGELLINAGKRNRLGSNALSTMDVNRGAVAKTLEHLEPYLNEKGQQPRHYYGREKRV